jgi:hypothetical protein
LSFGTARNIATSSWGQRWSRAMSDFSWASGWCRIE